MNQRSQMIAKFRLNNMIVNPEKFQTLIIQKSGSSEICTLQTDGKLIETANSIKLLGITFDHISQLCNKASMQFNEIGQIKRLFLEKNWK